MVCVVVTLVISTRVRAVQAVAAAFPPAPRPHFSCGARAGGKAITPSRLLAGEASRFRAKGVPIALARRSGVRRRASGGLQPKDGRHNVRTLPLSQWRTVPPPRALGALWLSLAQGENKKADGRNVPSAWMRVTNSGWSRATGHVRFPEPDMLL